MACTRRFTQHRTRKEANAECERFCVKVDRAADTLCVELLWHARQRKFLVIVVVPEAFKGGSTSRTPEFLLISLAFRAFYLFFIMKSSAAIIVLACVAAASAATLRAGNSAKPGSAQLQPGLKSGGCTSSSDFDYLMHVQQWPPTVCQDEFTCSVTPTNDFTMHGKWRSSKRCRDMAWKPRVTLAIWHGTSI